MVLGHMSYQMIEITEISLRGTSYLGSRPKHRRVKRGKRDQHMLDTAMTVGVHCEADGLTHEYRYRARIHRYAAVPPNKSEGVTAPRTVLLRWDELHARHVARCDADIPFAHLLCTYLEYLTSCHSRRREKRADKQRLAGHLGEPEQHFQPQPCPHPHDHHRHRHHLRDHDQYSHWHDYPTSSPPPQLLLSLSKGRLLTLYPKEREAVAEIEAHTDGDCNAERPHARCSTRRGMSWSSSVSVSSFSHTYRALYPFCLLRSGCSFRLRHSITSSSSGRLSVGCRIKPSTRHIMSTGGLSSSAAWTMCPIPNAI